MPRKSKGDYPAGWGKIALRVKEEAAWRCVRCDHSHEPAAGYTLTVHHLDMDPSNNRWWNLAALCQRCHLRIQSKVVMERPWLWDHSEWFRLYVAGYYAYHAGLRDDRTWVEKNAEALIRLGQGLATGSAMGLPIMLSTGRQAGKDETHVDQTSDSEAR